MSTEVATPTAAPPRSDADRIARRVLRLPAEGPQVSVVDAQSAFGRSMFIAAARCLVTYVGLPLLRPVVDLSGGIGPAVGIVLSLVSMAAIVFSARRFFAADHRFRWAYSAIGGGIFVLVVAQAIIDAGTLLR